jgi:spore coat polysaccharide biosynthesis protein SpsF
VIQIPNTAVFIPVRLGSSRLPRKPLIEVKGKTLIEHLIDRAKAAKLPNMIVLCTTTKPEDRIFGKIAKQNGIECFRGNEHDILKRFFDAATKFKVDFIVNVDGDDVFCDPELMDKIVQAYANTGADFIKWKDLPLGATPVGLKTRALQKVCEMKDTLNTETGWGGYFTETGLFRVVTIEPETDDMRHPEIRITLDYPEDLSLVKKVYGKLYRPGKIITLKEILQLFKREPELVKINEKVQEEYWKRFKKHANIRLKERSN